MAKNGHRRAGSEGDGDSNGSDNVRRESGEALKAL